MEIEMTGEIPVWNFWQNIRRGLRVWLMGVAEGLGFSSRREERFAEVIRDYGSMISGICFSFSADKQDAADLRQDILLNIWKGLATYREDSSLSTWLYRVALNTCVSTIRMRKRRVVTVALDSVGEVGSALDQGEQERIDWLYERIASLPPLDKAVVTMWLDNRPYEEIAEVIGISRNNVAVRLNRIKAKLSVGMGNGN